MRVRDGDRFRDLKSGTVKYRGKEYRVWDVPVGSGRTELFADVALYCAMLEHGDLDCSLDCKIAYYTNPDEPVKDAVRQYLE